MDHSHYIPNACLELRLLQIFCLPLYWRPPQPEPSTAALLHTRACQTVVVGKSAGPSNHLHRQVLPMMLICEVACLCGYKLAIRYFFADRDRVRGIGGGLSCPPLHWLSANLSMISGGVKQLIPCLDRCLSGYSGLEDWRIRGFEGKVARRTR